jgi:type I restriction enzyme S subunit
MEVKAGYILTDLGVIPEDWKTCNLTLISDVRDGTHDSPKYVKQGVPFVTSKNIVQGKVDLEDITYISEADAREVNKRSKVDKNDILLSMIGTVGNAALVDFEPEFCIKNVALIKPIESKINPQYLLQLFRSDQYGKYIDNKLDGGIQKFISLGILRSIDIPLPPTLTEQEAIAGALSDADALIESLEQLIAKKRLVKQGAMQELLTGKRRLPGFSGEWEVKRLGDVAEIIMGRSPSSVYYNIKGDGLPLIQGNADIGNRKTIKRVYTTEITKRGRCGDIIMSVRAPVGEISLAVFDVCLGRGVCAIRYDNDFMYHALIAKESTWVKLSKGSTFDSVNSMDVKAFELELPPTKTEQTAIATILSDMDAEIAALEEQLAKARQIKQGMMQELLTGRIRLV